MMIDFTPDFKPGDPPPDGYVAWHEWAGVQDKAGLKQVRCGKCSLFRFPQELSTETISGESRYFCKKSREWQTVVHTSPVCLKCTSSK